MQEIITPELLVMENSLSEIREDKVQELIASLLRGEKPLSFSSLKAFKESPKDFIKYCLREKEETEAMFFGSLVHCMVLEPDQFYYRYFILDDTAKCLEIGGKSPRATNAYKEWKQELIARNFGKKLVPVNIHQQAEIMASGITHNYAAARIMKMAPEREKKIEWQYKNFRFHGFVDMNGEVVIDLKTCADANPRKFQYEARQNNYPLQGGMYLTGLKENKPYYIIAADKKGGVSVHCLTEDIIQDALHEYERLVDRFNECMLKEQFDMSYDFFADNWQGYYFMDKR